MLEEDVVVVKVVKVVVGGSEMELGGGMFIGDRGQRRSDGREDGLLSKAKCTAARLRGR
jgi:hypothetical protein